jgi:hypothetical protein
MSYKIALDTGGGSLVERAPSRKSERPTQGKSVQLRRASELDRCGVCRDRSRAPYSLDGSERQAIPSSNSNVPGLPGAPQLKVRGQTGQLRGEKYASLIAFKETESTLLRLQMCADRLADAQIDVLSRLVFRWGLASLEAAIATGLVEGVEL